MVNVLGDKEGRKTGIMLLQGKSGYSQESQEETREGVSIASAGTRAKVTFTSGFSPSKLWDSRFMIFFIQTCCYNLFRILENKYKNKGFVELGMVVCLCNLSIWESEAGGQQAGGHAGLHSKAPSWQMNIEESAGELSASVVYWF